MGISRRRQARELLMKVLYEWSVGRRSSEVLLAETFTKCSEDAYDMVYFKESFQAIVEDIDRIDEIYQNFSKEYGEDLTPIEQAILRVACYELHDRIDIPPKVVINEAIELGKKYGAQDGFKFINGVTESVAKSLGKDLS